MLQRQVDNWNEYSDDLAAFAEWVLIDDGSPENPALPIFEKLRHENKRLYRVKDNIPWAQHHARNVGAFEASGQWLFMSDMDIVLKPDVFADIMHQCTDKKRVHTFDRKFVGGIREDKYHCNTFLIDRNAYWEFNGYDVDFCGTYGGDMRFLRQVYAKYKQLHHGHKSKHHSAETSGRIITLWGYEPDIVPDANTREWDRYGDMKLKYREIMKEKNKTGKIRSVNPIRYAYERVL